MMQDLAMISNMTHRLELYESSPYYIGAVFYELPLPIKEIGNLLTMSEHYY